MMQTLHETYPIQEDRACGLNNEQRSRRSKLEIAMRDLAFNYPNHFRRSHYAKELQEQHVADPLENLLKLSKSVAICGRIGAVRRLGKLIFLKIKDDSGAIQILLMPRQLGAECFEQWSQILDLGDIIGVKGVLTRTQRGELSVQACRVELLSKALRPLAEKYHGLVDPEIRQRKRYLELLSQPESQHRFVLRSKIIQAARTYLIEQGFLEVETPMMHPIPGGAAARPFITHHQALHQDLYLRVAPELYLKRLIVGGFEKIFELNRNFRNEGLSSRHNPEFTMLEFYQAYVGHEEMMQHVQDLLRFVVQAVFGTTNILLGKTSFDFNAPFQRLTLVEALQKYIGAAASEDWHSKPFLQSLCDRHRIQSVEHWGIGEYQFALFEALVEKELILPTLVIGYPASVSPLARRSDQNEELAERFELFVCGRELANGFSELNDPVTQAQVFHMQEKDKTAGNEEAMHFDHDYIEALECGLPPTGGIGIGMDRLVMWLTQCDNIRDIILFPTLKRK